MSLSWFSKLKPTIIEPEDRICPTSRRVSLKEPMIMVKSPKEDAILTQFKGKVSDLKQEDVVLLRFLKARDFDVTEAENMLRNMLEWRVENNIDALKSWDPPAHLKEDLHFKFLEHTDYNGVPMAWFPVGKWNAKKWVDRSQDDKSDVARYGYYIFESLFLMLKKHHRKQLGVIIDCKDLSFGEASHIPSLQILLTCCKALEQNYPEILSRVFIINAPWVFPIAYNFIKCIISKQTQAKIRVFGSSKTEWIKELLDYAPQEALPKGYFEDENGN